RMLAIAEGAVAADSCCPRRRLLRSRIAARAWHLMAGAVDVIPTSARLRAKSGAADDEDEWNRDLNDGSHLAHASQDRPTGIKKALLPISAEGWRTCSEFVEMRSSAVAVLACCLALALPNHGSAGEHRSWAVKRDFQRQHPCPWTGRPTGACP